jgi:hypothetical protein
MTIKIPRPIQFLLAFIFCLILYWPAIHGTPIWDDYGYWFQDTNMQPHMSYLTILTNFGWPISVSIQKFLLGIINKNYIIYHLISLSLHFINSLLLYRLARIMKLKYPFIYFLLFLLHPSGVITTAWMIQIKTLLCFFFGFSSMFFFLKGEKDLKWMVLSWILFFLSVGSKSASLTLPLIFFITHYRLYKFKKMYFVIPFFLISTWGTFNILKSPLTKEGSKRAAVVSKTIEEEPTVLSKTEQKKAVKPTKEKQKPKKQKKIHAEKKIESKPLEEKTITNHNLSNFVTRPSMENSKENKAEAVNTLLKVDFKKISQYLHYYFWQSFIPIRNEPVKGLNFEKAGRDELIHIFFLLCLIFIFIKDSALIYLLAAHIMLLPFIGIIPAPFMSITWVSDQHLYLVLPALLAFWMRVVDKINLKYIAALPICFIVFYSIKTFEATPFYKNQFTFYEKCLEYNPTNVPIAYNLAFARAINGDLIASQHILNETIDQSHSTPQMKKNIYYPYLINLYFMVNRAYGIK